MRRSTKYSKYQAKLDHAKPFPIELYMTKKENSQLIYDDRTTYMMCNCCLAALDVWPEHTFKRENFPFLPFYRNESLMEHSQSNRALLFYLQKRMLAHKEAMAHKTQLPNEWQAKILLQIHLKVSADLLAVYFLIGWSKTVRWLALASMRWITKCYERFQSIATWIKKTKSPNWEIAEIT